MQREKEREREREAVERGNYDNRINYNENDAVRMYHAISTLLLHSEL